MDEQTPLAEIQYQVGQRVYWDYPNDDMESGEFTVTKAGPYQRHYSYITCHNEAGIGGPAIHSELRLLPE